MKKFLVAALTLVMVLSLAACGGTTTPSSLSGETGSSSQQTEQSSSVESQSNTNTVEGVLARAGLTLAAVEPAEGYSEVRLEDSDTVEFVLKEGATADAGSMIYKLCDACKAASADGKLYEATIGFFMGTELTEFHELPSKEEINSKWSYLAQFGFLKGGVSIAITFGYVAGAYTIAITD